MEYQVSTSLYMNQGEFLFSTWNAGYLYPLANFTLALTSQAQPYDDMISMRNASLELLSIW